MQIMPLQLHLELVELSMIKLHISLRKDISAENVVIVSIPGFQRLELPGIILSYRPRSNALPLLGCHLQ